MDSAGITYEFNKDSDDIVAQLRVRGDLSLAQHDQAMEVGINTVEEHGFRPSTMEMDIPPGNSASERVIPLTSDTAFFHLFLSTLKSLREHLQRTQTEFMNTLQDLSRQIASTSLPASSSSHFQPCSRIDTNASTIHVSKRSLNKSDLDVWRAIFQLYVDSEIFESMAESERGEQSVEESERRLVIFSKKASESGQVVRHLQSRQALNTFLELNMLMLNIKKLDLANSEATRKILKKHTKRTALPLPEDVLGTITYVKPTSLPHIFVQAIGERLLPIIPHIDDYSCLICTALAFKPIRLECGHLFCVRCLIKMQRRGQGDCPMCRAPTVLIADRSNVDWALLNFMQDWFPTEAREKMTASEREATEEEVRALGLTLEQAACLIA